MSRERRQSPAAHRVESLASDQDPARTEYGGQQVADFVQLGEVVPFPEAGRGQPLGEAGLAGPPAARRAVADEVVVKGDAVAGGVEPAGE
jgi:hypothetical protein